MSFIKNLIDKVHPTMTAIGINRGAKTEEKDAFIRRRVAKPKPGDDDLLVKVLATSVNPVDTKMRSKYHLDGIFRILGLDGVGQIEEMGKNVTGFELGQKVYYVSGQQDAGNNAEYQAFNAGLAAPMPMTLSVDEAAAVPLTSVTAYDIVHRGFGLPVIKDAAHGQSLFIINGAGGVGSILIQLAKYLGMTVVTTAGTHRSKKWVEELGADYVVDYHEDLTQQLRTIDQTQFEYIANLQDTNAYWDLMSVAVAPYGKIASIVETTAPVDLGALKDMAVQFTWIFMLARANYGKNLAEQGEILEKMGRLFDQGVLKSTLTKVYHGLTTEALREAHHEVESQHTVGKVVIDFREDQQ
ncbi:zinc-binding alcohol dehydrogenase family protein [Leuconostocaceae bacterium ESL0723]|nr:zinc-binding alcohol dehydrogenase family protein [Leuconostocaceae bacterium ESL0723]